MNSVQLIAACDRLLAVEKEVGGMDVESQKWFFGKEGHRDCFIVARALKIRLEKEMKLPLVIKLSLESNMVKQTGCFHQLKTLAEPPYRYVCTLCGKKLKIASGRYPLKT